MRIFLIGAADNYKSSQGQLSLTLIVATVMLFLGGIVSLWLCSALIAFSSLFIPDLTVYHIHIAIEDAVIMISCNEPFL